MPVNDTLQTRLTSYTPTQVGFNIRHYLVTATAPPEATLIQIAVFLDNLFAPLYKACMSNQARWRGVGVKKILPLPQGLESISIGNDGVGAVVADLLPGQTSGVITLRSAVAGRSFRGRAYVPFPSEADNGASAAPVAAYVANLFNLGAQLVAPIVVPNGVGSSSLQPVVFHRATLSSTFLVQFVAKQNWGTQRRRGGFGRPNALPF